MIILYSLLILIFPFIISINVLIYRSIVKNALKKYIEPKLKEKGLVFIDYKWPGFFSNGDFEDDTMALTIMNKNGNVYNSSYAYIYYKEEEGSETRKVTVRIGTIFWFINKITYSSEF
jgi:hypothetical protein